MARKIQKTKTIKQETAESSRRTEQLQIMFAVFAIILILSMVLSAVTNY